MMRQLVLQLVPAIRHEKRIAWVFLAVIIASYSFSIVPELDDWEPYYDYIHNILPRYNTCELADFSTISLTNGFLKNWFNCFSYKILVNDKVLPFIFSIGLVYLVYLAGHYITNDRIIGLISASCFTINPLFTEFDTSPTYSTDWSFFLILSVVLLYKKSTVAPVVYALSIMSKIIAFGYLPVFFYHIISEKIKHKKIVCTITFLLLIIGSFASMSMTGLGFYPQRLELGLNELLRYTFVILPFLVLFTCFIAFFKSKIKITGLKVVSLWIFWFLLTTPLLYIFSDEFQYPYRFIPLAVFMSIYIGMAVVNFGNKAVEIRTETTKKNLIKGRLNQ